MKCPVCKEINLVMSERQGIEIDYCPECRGVWLDRGELDKIIDKSNIQMKFGYQEHQNSKDSNYNEKNYNMNESHNNQNGRKKESFISNVFDIFGGD